MWRRVWIEGKRSGSEEQLINFPCFVVWKMNFQLFSLQKGSCFIAVFITDLTLAVSGTLESTAKHLVRNRGNILQTTQAGVGQYLLTDMSSGHGNGDCYGLNCVL